MFGRKKNKDQAVIPVFVTRLYEMRVNRIIGKHAAEEWGDWHLQGPTTVPPSVTDLLAIPHVASVTINYTREGLKAEYRVQHEN